MKFDYNTIDKFIHDRDDKGLRNYFMHLKLDWHLIKKDDLADLVIHCVQEKINNE